METDLATLRTALEDAEHVLRILEQAPTDDELPRFKVIGGSLEDMQSSIGSSACAIGSALGIEFQVPANFIRRVNSSLVLVGPHFVNAVEEIVSSGHAALEVADWNDQEVPA